MLNPLPEQGGFNERLDAILDIHDNLVLLRQAAGDDGNELRVATRQSIRTLVLEEIIGEDVPNSRDGNMARESYTSIDTSSGKTYVYIEQPNTWAYNNLKAEQRLRLGGTHGTK